MLERSQLAASREPFERRFRPQCRTVVGLRPEAEQPQRPAVPGIAGAPARAMCLDAASQIVGPAGVKGAVGAFDDVDPRPHPRERQALSGPWQR